MLEILIASSISSWLVTLLNLLLILVLVRRVSQLSAPEADLEAFSSILAKGSRAPYFQAETVAGGTLSLTDFAYQPVTLIFISPYCGPCVDKLPRFNTVAAIARNLGIKVVVVMTDGNKLEIEALITKYQLTMPVLIPSQAHSSFVNDYQATDTPSFCVLNRYSRVIASGLLNPTWEHQLAGIWSAMIMHDERRYPRGPLMA